MFGSVILDVAIGMVFVYLVLSLVVTAGHELVAATLNLRGKNLTEGIRNLLDQAQAASPQGERPAEPAPPGSLAGKFERMLADDKAVIAAKAGEADRRLSQMLYNHPLVKALYRKNKVPSYIPARTFALALLDIVVPAGDERRNSMDGMRQAIKDSDKLNPQVQKCLLVLMDEAEANMKEAGFDLAKVDVALNKVHENIEVWFNSSMERVSGWYKRKTQAWTFGMAMVFTIAMCIDSVTVARALANDGALRASLVSMAEKAAKETLPNQPGGDPQEIKRAFENFTKSVSDVQGLGIPVGWDDPRNQFTGQNWFVKIFGLLISAVAASLGAPFWFDILNKIISIRSSGKAPEEKPKPPKEEPQPLGPGETPEEKRLREESSAALVAGIGALTHWAAAQGLVAQGLVAQPKVGPPGQGDANPGTESR
jgi:hypothetical protein